MSEKKRRGKFWKRELEIILNSLYGILRGNQKEGENLRGKVGKIGGNFVFIRRINIGKIHSEKNIKIFKLSNKTSMLEF